MVRRKKKQVGLQEWTVESAAGEEGWNLLKKGLRELEKAGHPVDIRAGRRREIAKERLVYWLKRVSEVVDPDDQERQLSEFFEWTGGDIDAFPPPGIFPEGSYDHLLSTWLRTLRALQTARANEDADAVAAHAFELGRLEERFWWRFGKDTDTGRRREELALSKKRSQAALPSATEAARLKAQDSEPDWRDEVRIELRDIRAKKPSVSDKEAAERIWTRMLSPPVKQDTIRKYIATIS